MSETETWTGVLVSTGLTVEQVMNDIEFPEYYDRTNQGDVYDFFADMFYGNKVEVNGIVYDVQKENLDDEDIFQAKLLDDGKINFTVQYYNGACGFDEAIKKAVTDCIGQVNTPNHEAG